MRTNTPPTRRSARVIYDSNGRDYLCSVTGWTRDTLDQWLISDSVRSHLQLWYAICIQSKGRFNEGVDWINTGYFYDEGALEEDVLLLCLNEGNSKDTKDNATSTNGPAYADKIAITCKWITAEVWGRTSWRIVQDNVGRGEAFEKAVIEHPSAAYAFVIDVLCLAFHSIAYRGKASVWEVIINGDDHTVAALPDPEAMNDIDPDAEDDFDTDEEMGSEVSSDESIVGDDDYDDDSDEDFIEKPVTPKAKGRVRMANTPSPKVSQKSKLGSVEPMDAVEPTTPMSSKSARKTASPKAPKKQEDVEMVDNIVVAVKAPKSKAAVREVSPSKASKKKEPEIGENIIVAMKVKSWMEGLAGDEVEMAED